MSVFVAFDVETPNRYNDRMSAIGITVIRDGAISGEYYSLVDPEVHFDYVKPLGVETPSILLPPSSRAVGL